MSYYIITSSLSKYKRYNKQVKKLLNKIFFFTFVKTNTALQQNFLNVGKGTARWIAQFQNSFHFLQKKIMGQGSLEREGEIFLKVLRFSLPNPVHVWNSLPTGRPQALPFSSSLKVLEEARGKKTWL